MFTMDIPDVPVHATPIVLAQADVVRNSAQETKNILGVCEMAHGKTDVFPTYNAGSYMAQFKGKDNFSYGASVKVIQSPKQGTLLLTDVTSPDTYVYSYTPDKLPTGTKDYFVVSVENKGVTVNIRYYIYIDILGPNEPADVNYCGDKQFWKISFSEESMLMSYRAQPIVRAGLAQKRASPSTSR
ncbi:MAG TPA: hypothetical protein VIU93_08615 [Gallionellaceae bacterium]